MVNYGGKEVFMTNAKITITRGATCKCCGNNIIGEVVKANIALGKTAYIHPECATLGGEPLAEFNDNGGSTHYFDVDLFGMFGDDGFGDALAWAIYARSLGFKTKSPDYYATPKTVTPRIGGFWVSANADKMPAQSISKALKALKIPGVSIMVNHKEFRTLDEALWYIKHITNGNSHEDIK